jgi:hypothetical protein
MSSTHANDHHAGPWREPEREAFEAVLAAIEDGLDVEGVRPEFKALLAELHKQAGLCIGIRPLRIPPTPQEAAKAELLAQARKAFSGPPPREPTAHDAKWSLASDGINKLEDTRAIGYRAWAALYDADVLTIEAVDELARAGQLTTIRRVGPKMAAQIEEALSLHGEKHTHGGGES